MFLDQNMPESWEMHFAMLDMSTSNVEISRFLHIYMHYRHVWTRWYWVLAQSFRPVSEFYKTTPSFISKPFLSFSTFHNLLRKVRHQIEQIATYTQIIHIKHYSASVSARLDHNCGLQLNCNIVHGKSHNFSKLTYCIASHNYNLLFFILYK